MTPGPVPLDGPHRWWEFVPGACWSAPEGPGSDTADRADHPVVHVSLIDALAFANWAGAALPTEAEWECAARAGQASKFPWGDRLTQGGALMANVWTGDFPWRHDRLGKGPFSMPVDAFRPNDWGLFNMIGNVWEWTVSEFSRAMQGAKACCGPAACDPARAYVLKGGSFLCAPSYCQRYRPAARSPLDPYSSTSHLGFRCVGARSAEPRIRWAVSCDPDEAR